MNRIKYSTIVGLVIVGISFSYCGSGEPENSDDLNSVEIISTSLSVDQVKEIYLKYIEIKDALVNSNDTGATNKAKELISNFNDLEDPLLNKIRIHAEEIASSNDIEYQREKFFALSTSMYSLLKGRKDDDLEVYKQYCPMAFDGEGAYWFSSEKEIFNPYFGDRMLHCGSIKEEL